MKLTTDNKTEGMKKALKLMARKEAILLDPVYSGKAFDGLIGLVKKGHFKNSDKILFKGICIWSYLRIYAYDKAYTGSGTAQNASSVPKSILIKSLLWQLPKLGKFETLVLSSSDQRKWIDNLWYDRFDFHPELKEKALVVEIPSPQHKPHGLMASKHAYSKIWWYAIELVISKTLAKPIIQGERILKDLLN